jgi:hypothetical protein
MYYYKTSYELCTPSLIHIHESNLDLCESLYSGSPSNIYKVMYILVGVEFFKSYVRLRELSYNMPKSEELVSRYTGDMVWWKYLTQNVKPAQWMDGWRKHVNDWFSGRHDTKGIVVRAYSVHILVPRTKSKTSFHQISSWRLQN